MGVWFIPGGGERVVFRVLAWCTVEEQEEAITIIMEKESIVSCMSPDPEHTSATGWSSVHEN